MGEIAIRTSREVSWKGLYPTTQLLTLSSGCRLHVRCCGPGNEGQLTMQGTDPRQAASCSSAYLAGGDRTIFLELQIRLGLQGAELLKYLPGLSEGIPLSSLLAGRKVSLA